jgi:hypothetical protein
MCACRNEDIACCWVWQFITVITKVTRDPCPNTFEASRHLNTVCTSVVQFILRSVTVQWAEHQLFNKHLVTLVECTFSIDLSHCMRLEWGVGGEMEVFSGRQAVSQSVSQYGVWVMFMSCHSKLLWGPASVPGRKLSNGSQNYFSQCPGCSVILVTRLWAGQPSFDSRQETWFFSPCHGMQIGSWSHPASYPIRIRGSFIRRKVSRTWSWPFISV